MNLTPQLQLAMSQINRALIANDEHALVQALQSVPLSEILSQDSIEKVRARGKTSLAIFLATLAVNNEVEPVLAQHWLDCYQSIVQRQFLPAIAQLKSDNVLRTTIAVLGKQIEAHQALAPWSGNSTQWVQALELAIDHQQWGWAQKLMEGATPRTLKANTHHQVWLMFSKLLAKRHNLFVDNSGQTHAGIDYSVLAGLYGLCENHLSMHQVTAAAVTTAYLQAKCLEAAKRYDDAIEVLQRLARKHPAEFQSVMINRARCECKRGDESQAIATLDHVIARHLQSPASANDHGVLESIEPAKHDAQKAGSFNVAAASAALADLATIFKANDIPFFLVSGTLLGYVREGQLLAHDKDIDVGVLGWEQQYKIGNALLNSTQFALSADFLKGEKAYYIPISHNATGIIIDLFVYHEDQGKYVTGVDFFFGYRQTFAFTPFALKETEFLGVPMYVPEDSELKLRENFGDWRIPDPGYISHLEAPCTVDKGGFGHMMTARLQLINALKQKKSHKVQRIVQVLGQHPDSSWAMSSGLLEKLKASSPPAAVQPAMVGLEPMELAHV